MNWRLGGEGEASERENPIKTKKEYARERDLIHIRRQKERGKERFEVVQRNVKNLEMREMANFATW